MDKQTLRDHLSDLPLGPLRYFDHLGSTNDEAARWASQGAPHLSLVVADEQTAGRGRLGRRWFTPPSSALAFSLVLRVQALATTDSVLMPRLTALGGLAVCHALQNGYGLQAGIKWPNDILVQGKKLAGVLVEAKWLGDFPLAAIIGIGINIAEESVPPETELLFPAGCVESALGKPVDRWELLHHLLQEILVWLPRLTSAEFIRHWDELLVYRGEMVQVLGEGQYPREGRLEGLDATGALQIRLASGELIALQFGELSLRPVDSPTESAKLVKGSGDI